MSNPLKLLAKLRRFDGLQDPKKYLQTEYRQNLKAIEDAFRNISVQLGNDITQVQDEIPESGLWTNAGTTTITSTGTSPTKGTVSVDNFWYRIEGPDAIVRIDYKQTSAGGAAGTGSYIIAIPSVIGEIETSITGLYTGTVAATGICTAVVGYGNSSNNVTVLQGSVIVYSETQVRLCGLVGAATYEFWGQPNSNLSGAVTLSLNFRIPLKQT